MIILFRGRTLDQLALLEAGSGSDEGDEVGRAFTAHQRVWADSMSLKAIAMPAARKPGPLVTRCRKRTVAKVDSIVI